MRSEVSRYVHRLREESGLSQAQLAGKLSFTSSRLSRVESGEIGLAVKEAIEIASAIGTPRAEAYAEYLSRDWSELEAPGFDHPNVEALWQADQALQRLRTLLDDPELRNAFVRQIRSCRDGLLHAARFLESVEHPVAFVGSPGVGKTTVICSLASDLRDWGEDLLDKQTVLQTGAGRTTICEVQVRRGGEFSLSIEPCSDLDLRAHVAEFCEFLLARKQRHLGGDQGEAQGMSAEMQRTLRNMTGLTIKKTRQPDGKFRTEDPAQVLAERYEKREDLQIEVLTRLDLPRRRRTSIAHPESSTTPPIKWLSKVFAEVNFGRHAEFSLPRRIDVTIPGDVLAATHLDVRLIDTRGVDEPSAPRRDLQAHLDDDRCVVVLCSKFEDAPSGAVQAVIERAVGGGLRDALVDRGLLLVLPKGREEAAVLDDVTGEAVNDVEEGRVIRSSQVKETTLTDLRVPELPIEFTNVFEEPECRSLEEILRCKILDVRSQMSVKIDQLVNTADELVNNRENEEARAVFEQATHPLLNWLRQNGNLEGEYRHADDELESEMRGLRYASSLRASVNRRGDWHNFDYWQGLGFGVRRNVVERSQAQVNGLRAVLNNARTDQDLEMAHGFLSHFASRLDEAVKSLYLEAEQLGAIAFAERLGGDDAYWHQCQGRWGGGSGYKGDIQDWTKDWFARDEREAMHEFIKLDVERRWSEMIDVLADLLESGDSGSE